MHWIDPDHLPKTNGVVDRFLINPHGEIDGILLADDLEVHVPPHLSAEIRAAVKPGATLAVYGVRSRHAEMIAAVAIEADSGRRIVDNGPPNKERKHPKQHDAGHKHRQAPHSVLEAEGIVRRPLHGPKGEVRGALLEDGRIIRVPPHEAEERATLLQAGAGLAARGPGIVVDGATVIDAREFGASMAVLQPVRPKALKGDKKRPETPKYV